MNTCDTCKHWFWPKGYEHYGDGFSGKPCKNVGKHTKWQDDSTEIGNCIDSYLVTGPKFGCIHHEPKE